MTQKSPPEFSRDDFVRAVDAALRDVPIRVRGVSAHLDAVSRGYEHYCTRPRDPGKRMAPPTSGSLRGLNPSFVIVDELQEFDHWSMAPLTWRDVPVVVYATVAAGLALCLSWVSA